MKGIKLICLVCVFVTLVCAFTACSNSDKGNETVSENASVSAESASKNNSDENSTTSDSDTVFYDRYGKTYSELTELPYYTQDGDIYYYGKSEGKSCFFDKNKNVYDVNRCFIDPRGYFVYDEEGNITLDESALMANGKDGITYFPAITIRWTVDHKMVLAFGFGKEIEMLDDDVELK